MHKATCLVQSSPYIASVVYIWKAAASQRKGRRSSRLHHQRRQETECPESDPIWLHADSSIHAGKTPRYGAGADRRAMIVVYVYVRLAAADEV
jgi:hypothetical protein